MKKTTALTSFFAAVLLANTSFAADTYLSSPAFIQQISGSASASMSTAAIMKPMTDMMASFPTLSSTPSAGNLANTLQIGDANFANIDQLGSGNVAMIQQNGYMNTASITQRGGNNQAFIAQQGNHNVAMIRQR